MGILRPFFRASDYPFQMRSSFRLAGSHAPVPRMNSLTNLYSLPFPSLNLSLLTIAPPFLHPPFFYTMQGDNGNHLIRLLVLSSGVVSTLAGQAGSSGSTNGIGTNARFYNPNAIALDAAGTFAVVVRGEVRGT